jgi:hypothetical protein
MADKFQGIRLGRKTIEHSRGSRPFAGVQARVETSAEINSRPTPLREVLSDGLAAQLLKPEVKDDQLFLTVLGPDFEWSVAVEPERVRDARSFAGKVNAAVGASGL